jgi:primase-polymerase (primpol)-like protein
MTSPASAPTRAAQPSWLPVLVENIPPDLAADVAWYPALIRPKRNKPGAWDKIPADPETAEPAVWSDTSTRCTLDIAFMAYQRDPRFGGIGYLMHGDGLIGIDLDHCVSPDGSVAQWALDIVRCFPDAYWERSISGTGLRGFCRGELPDDADGCRTKIDGCSVELYSSQRFLCVTGQVVRT